MIYVIGFIIPIISFLLQAFPRFFNRYFGVDVWTRMIEADLIRKNRHRIPMQKIRNGFIIEGYFNYPPLFPWILSFFPKKKLHELQGFIAPIFDSLHNLVLFFIVLQLTGQPTTAFVAQIIYATIPLIILENSYLTPRSLGYLNFTLAFYPVLLYSITPQPLYLTIGFLFTVLIFFTHKFATQSLLFISIFFSLIETNVLYVGVFFGALTVALIISKGYYMRILHGHIANILFWVKNYQYRFAHQIRGLVKQRKKTDLVGYIYYLLGIFTPITLVGTNLWIMFPFIFLTFTMLGFGIFPIDHLLWIKMASWAVFFYVFATVVLSFKILIPIGEGQRYLEMAAAPTAILTAVMFSSLLNTNLKYVTIGIYCIIASVNILITLFIQWKGVIEDKNRSVTKDMNRVFTYINGLQPTPRILCIPHQITTMVLYNTRAHVLVDIEAGTLQQISDVYPIIKKSMNQLTKKYHLTLLVLKKHYATMEELKLNKKSLLLETEDTQVIKLPGRG